jgi:hypothetical protein
MMASTGLEDIGAKILSECGLVSALLVSAVFYLALRLAQATKGWEEDRDEAAKRIDAANATIFRLVEASNEADRAYAVALSRLEVMLTAAQARKGDDC